MMSPTYTPILPAMYNAECGRLREQDIPGQVEQPVQPSSGTTSRAPSRAAYSVYTGTTGGFPSFFYDTETNSANSDLKGLIVELRSHLDARLETHEFALERLLREQHEQQELHKECLSLLTSLINQGTDAEVCRQEICSKTGKQEKCEVETPPGDKSGGTPPPEPEADPPFIVTNTPSFAASAGRMSTKDSAPSLMASMAEETEELPACLMPKPPAQTSKPTGRSPQRFRDDDEHEWVDSESRADEFLRRWEQLVSSARFDYAIGVVIVLNTFFLGIQTDIKSSNLLNNADDKEPASFSIIETIFCIVFVLEMVARMIAFRWRYPLSGWNLFDAFVVSGAIVEEVIKWGVGGDSIAGKLSVFRMLRVVKLLRTIRIIRVVRAFRELRIVLASIVSCMRSLFWTCVLLFVLLYFMSILILVELTGSTGPYDGDSEGALLRRRYFPSLARSLLTVFQTTTGGVLWEPLSTALQEIIPWVNLLWAAYVGFVTFAIMNIVTGIFVDQAMSSASNDMRNVALEEHDQMSGKLMELRHMFRSADPQGRGFIHREAMRKLCTDKKATEFFRKMDIDVRDIFSFFDLVSDDKGRVQMDDVDRFSQSCFRLKGFARSMGVQAMTFLTKERNSDTRSIRRALSSQLCALRESIGQPSPGVFAFEQMSNDK